jgi:hypothetical protein
VDVEVLSVEPARNEGPFCVKDLVSGGVEAWFRGAAVSCRGTRICSRCLEQLGVVVRAVQLGTFSLWDDFSSLGTGEPITRISGRPSHFQYHSGLLYRRYEPEVWNVRWLGPQSLEFRSRVASSLSLHCGIRNNLSFSSRGTWDILKDWQLRALCSRPP